MSALLAGVGMGNSAMASEGSGTGIHINGRPLYDEKGIVAVDRLAEAVGSAQIVLLAGDSREQADDFHRARRDLISALHEELGFTVLVLPVGLFEGARLDRELQAGVPPGEASVTVYRVWRESEPFNEILADLQRWSASDRRLEVIGGLSRFHAAAKALYGPHLVDFFDEADALFLTAELRSRLETVWAGTDRLSRSTPEVRARAADLARDLLERFDEVTPALEKRHGSRRVELERQILVNMATFVELERIRGGDVAGGGDAPDGEGFEEREKAQNLAWFLEKRFRGERLIYWTGRGAAANLPTDRPVARLEITLEP